MKNQKKQTFTTNEYIILAMSISIFILLRVILLEGIIMSAIMPVIGYFIGLGIINLMRKKKK